MKVERTRLSRESELLDHRSPKSKLSHQLKMTLRCETHHQTFFSVSRSFRDDFFARSYSPNAGPGEPPVCRAAGSKPACLMPVKPKGHDPNEQIRQSEAGSDERDAKKTRGHHK